MNLSPVQIAVNDLSRNFAVIPIVAGEKRAAVEWKAFQSRRPTARELRTWFTVGDQNLAIVCGAVSGGLAVLDIDDPELADRVADDEALQAETTLVRTPRGGLHVYVIEVEAVSRGGPIVPGVADLQAEGRYVLAPPSSIGRREYAILTNSTIKVVPDARVWALGLLRAFDVQVEIELPAKAAPAVPAGDQIPEGARNASLISLAGSMRRRGMSEEAMCAGLLAENTSRCQPPLPEEEVRAIAASAARYVPAAGQADEEVHETDLGNAVRLVSRHGQDIHYCFPQSRWYAWDGTRWARDAVGEVYRRGKDTVRSIFAEAAATPTDDQSKRLALHAIRSEAEGRIRAMIALARSEPGIPVTPEVLDTDPWALNVQNGTIDLRSGELRQQRREDLITKLSPVTYNPDAGCPRWLAFLDRIMASNAELMGFLQRAVGYSLTGDVSEQALFFQHGVGANGKTTFLEAVLAMLGDYGKQAAPGLLTVKRGERHPTEIADLAGARLVATVEVDEGRRLAEALMKWITGGDRVKARHMREDFFEFQPTHKLWLAANHKPTIVGSDLAVWRRIRLIPFNVVIPPEEQDHGLLAKLKAELPGILNWAVQGCLQWHQDGLNPPQEVVAATDQYRIEQDTIASFFDDRCRLGENEVTTAAALYAAYKSWCEQTGETAMPKRRFGTRLGERGLNAGKSPDGKHRMWEGVGLLTQLQI